MDKRKYEDLIEHAASIAKEDGPDAGLNYLDDCVKNSPFSIEVYLARGVVYTIVGDHEREAFADFEKAIAIDPTVAESYFHRGMLCAQASDDMSRSFNDFCKVIELDPAFSEAYNNRAKIYLMREELQKAIDDCNKAIELSPDDMEPYYNRGLAYINLKEPELEKAFDDYNKVIELVPENAEAYTKRGLLYALSGNIQEAIRDYETFLRLDPNNQNAHLVRDELMRLESGKPPFSKKKGCYIATAVYNSYDAPEVLTLRRFRDEVLAASVFGRAFIRLYYFVSPPIAEWLKGARRVNAVVRGVLDRIVWRLNKKNKKVLDTPPPI